MAKLHISAAFTMTVVDKRAETWVCITVTDEQGMPVFVNRTDLEWPTIVNITAVFTEWFGGEVWVPMNVTGGSHVVAAPGMWKLRVVTDPLKGPPIEQLRPALIAVYVEMGEDQGETLAFPCSPAQPFTAIKGNA